MPYAGQVDKTMGADTVGHLKHLLETELKRAREENDLDIAMFSGVDGRIFSSSIPNQLDPRERGQDVDRRPPPVRVSADYPGNPRLLRRSRRWGTKAAHAHPVRREVRRDEGVQEKQGYSAIPPVEARPPRRAWS